jgi:anaerobic magnesium-protoporphyrin IX monomethyl ester cyclase
MTDSILFLNPPSPNGICADREALYGMGVRRPAYARAQPPHTLAWSAAQLRESEWEVHGLDAVALGLDENATIRDIQLFNPALIVALTSYVTAAGDAAFLKMVRERLPHAKILLVSHAAAFLPVLTAQAADMLLIGEPEGAIHAACAALLDDDGVRGVVSARSLEVAAYDARNTLIDISYLAPPLWDIFDVQRYETLPVLSARGCNYGCRYCPAPKTQGGLRVRLAERVAAELQLLVTRHRIRNFYFIDPLFGADRTHITALLRAIERRDLGKEIIWQCETRPETLDVPLIRRMRRAGCRVIHLGVESVSPMTLEATGRLEQGTQTPDYLALVRQIVLACRAYGVECHLHLMAGLPGDPAGATATRAFMRAYADRSGQVTRFHPLPGTTIYPTFHMEEEWMTLQDTLPQESETISFTLDEGAEHPLAKLLAR